jgi:hypothetical protein
VSLASRIYLMSIWGDFLHMRTCGETMDCLPLAMPSKKPMAKVRAKVRRALRNGAMPIDIARKLGIPLLLIAEIAIWEATLRQARGTGLDL